jgi:hypothetical protein
VEEDRALAGLCSECGRLRVMGTGQDLGQPTATDSLRHDIVTILEEMPVKDEVYRHQKRQCSECQS